MNRTSCVRLAQSLPVNENLRHRAGAAGRHSCTRAQGARRPSRPAGRGSDSDRLGRGVRGRARQLGRGDLGLGVLVGGRAVSPVRVGAGDAPDRGGRNSACSRGESGWRALRRGSGTATAGPCIPETEGLPRSNATCWPATPRTSTYTGRWRPFPEARLPHASFQETGP